MINQLTNGIRLGILTAAISVLVAGMAHATIVYEWTPANEVGYGSETSGTLELTCGAWDDDVVQVEDTELVGFEYIDGTGRLWGRDEVHHFVVNTWLDAIQIRMGHTVEDGMLIFTRTWASEQTNVEWYATVQDWVGEYQGTYDGVWRMDADASTCGDGHSPDPVPEPATLSLLGIGLVGLIGGAARKKLKKKALAKT